MTPVDIEESGKRLQEAFEGKYGDCPIREDDRYIGKVSEDERRIYLTFRGSVNSFWEILTCLDIRKASLEKMGLFGKVHRGIYTAFMKVHPFVLQKLQSMDPRKEIIVEGYSRGAGIASVLGLALQTRFPDRSITVLSYSPMKIFDGKAICNKVANIFNFICKEDWIPCWAPSFFGFCRIGEERFFSAKLFPEYTRRVNERTYLHMMSGTIAKLIQCFLPARIWEAHMPETYREGAAI